MARPSGLPADHYALGVATQAAFLLGGPITGLAVLAIWGGKALHDASKSKK